MKIDRSKLKKSSSEMPADCKALIERLTACGRNKDEFLRELQRIETWTYGKCELYHWIDVLDMCDEVLEMAAAPMLGADAGSHNGPWLLSCDTPSYPGPHAGAVSANVAARVKELLLWTLHFTTLLIEHSFSRHLYSSMEHLTALLASSDLDVVLAVLNLLYMFSKRSNFITRLAPEKRNGLLNRLTHLAASWGGKDNGFGLAKCCSDDLIETFPESATNLHFEFYAEMPAVVSNAAGVGGKGSGGKNLASTVTVIHIENVDKLNETPAKIMGQILRDYQVPKDKQMLLFTYLRLAASFSDYGKRLKCVQARLQALSVLIYSNQLTDNIQSLLYSGLLEELVEVLEMKGDHLMEIKAAALKALTSIIHLDRNPNFPKLNTIIDVTGAASYHGFLPTLVRNCIASLTAPHKESAAGSSKSQQHQPFPQPLATALFSFLYHLASYEAGGEALVSCGMLESLLKVIQWPSTELDHITFVTRAVRVIDLITNLDMQSFQTHSGLTCFINRLELEVEHCRQQQPFEIRVGSKRKDSLADALEQHAASEAAAAAAATGSTTTVDDSQPMEVDDPVPGPSKPPPPPPEYLVAPKPGVTCLPQRAALLKSMLNFLKKAIQDPAFSDSIRHVMDLSLPNSLKHIISNAEYYGASLFLLATDVVTAYVFQEPSLLSSLQDKGLTDVVLNALLVKDVPATREVLGSLPNVFSALCLNSRGLDAFVACKPFERLFKVLLSPDYLPAMRRRRSSDPMGDTASNLGNAMDELMRHQPSLKQAATVAIIKLLEEVLALGRDPKVVCWKPNTKPEQNGSAGAPASNANPATSGPDAGGSSDEEDEEDEEQSSNQPQENPQTEQTAPQPSMSSSSSPTVTAEKEPVPLVDYIHNVMKFVDAILSNNSTDDHCREFVQQKGLIPLMSILSLPNLPLDFPTHQACQSVAAVSKSILTLAHEPQVLRQGLLHLCEVLKMLEPLHNAVPPPGGSILLRELVNAPVLSEATSSHLATPLLHGMSSAHAYIQMFVHVCRTGQNDIRTMSIAHWGSDLGLEVLRQLSRLYTSLVWESTVLLALCSEDTLPPGCEFGKADMDKLLPPGVSSLTQQPQQPTQPVIELKAGTENEETFSPASGTSADSNSSVTAAMENLSTEPELAGMDVDPTVSTANQPGAAQPSNSSGGGEKNKEKSNPALHFQIKQIKPLLSGSSRLGRALAELFALLVKLCVGSPLRQRRGQQLTPSPAPPTAPARAVATSLTRLLASGLSWEPPPTSPIPRFRLTFFICSVGFTAPMLFDEKKFPYHLMLMKFISSGGQNAFFETFYWALSCGGVIEPEAGLEHPDLPDGTGEFLDSWLLLLEKMVNPKTVLESPHTLPSKPTTGFRPFDPMKYLARTHRLAFLAVMKLWGKKPLKVYGARMTESVLSILCHILKGEKIIAEKLEKKDPTASVSSRTSQPGAAFGIPPTEPSAGSRSEPATSGSGVHNAPTEQPARPDPPEPDINPAHLSTLMDMGFPRERCVEAIQSTGSLDQATDYLLNNPLPPLNAGAALGALGAAGGESQDELMRAIALSLGENVMVSQSQNQQQDRAASELESQEDERFLNEDFAALDRPVIDEFTESALVGCLGLVDTLPDTVYRVCDLLLAVFSRNGPDFKETVLRDLIREVVFAVDKLNERLNGREKFDLESFCSGPDALRAAARIHLFTLLFEDCKVLCAKIVHDSQASAGMIRLLSLTARRNVLAGTSKVEQQEEVAAITPKWMTPMLLFLDLHEKVVLGMNRRARLSKICSHTWKWFDISSGRWCSYAQANNKTIDDAFWAGEANVKIQNGRRKYMIQFGSMMQANEETGNRRPVMISLIETPKPTESSAATSQTDQTSTDSTTTTASTTTKSEVSSVQQQTSEDFPELPSIPVLGGMCEENRDSLLKACVALVAVPVDADALNAVLRLCLRLTQDFKQAVLFTQLGGVKLLLGLTQSSNFSGFVSLTTLLIRHVMEDPETLQHTMEKAIRSSTVNSNSSNTKELHYLLRMLAPAACRSPEIFVTVARDIMRVDFSLLSKRPGEADGEDQRLLMKSRTLRSQQPPALEEVAQFSVINDLLNFLIQPDGDPEDEGSSVNSNEAVVNPTVPSTSTSTSSSSSSSVAATATAAATTAAAATASAGTNRTQVSIHNIMRNSSSGELTVPPTENVIPSAAATAPSLATPSSSSNKKKDSSEETKKVKKPLLTKSVVCRLLAELVKSYSSCAKLITDHIYEPGISELVTEEVSALAFILDELLISRADKDLGQLVKTLVAALASCNQQPEAQATLVSEVKSALARALSWPESHLKHVRVQALTALVSTMIESCPPTAQTSQQSGYKQQQPQQYNMNNMVKVLLKRGIVSDLARVPHSLDLSSPYVAGTVNAALKPLEILTRIVNTPTAIASRAVTGTGKKSQQHQLVNTDQADGGTQESLREGHDMDGTTQVVNNANSAGGGAGTNTTNSEATRAQGDESVEPDAEATEHDVSTAAESIDPNSESLLQTAAEGNDEEFDEMMEQLLERDGTQDQQPILAEVIEHEIDRSYDVDDTAHNSQMISQDESHFEAQAMSQDEEDRESESSHSDVATEDNEDEEGVDEEDDDVNGEEEEEDGEDEEDEDEDDEDEEAVSPFDDEDEADEFHDIESAIYRFPLGDNETDDIDLMIHYPDSDNAIQQTLDNTRAIHLPLWSDVGVSSGGVDALGGAGGAAGAASHVTPNHPLLMGRQPGSDASSMRSNTRNLPRSTRGGGGIRIHLNSRAGNALGNPSAPAILQNFLGNPQDLIQHTLRRGTPLLVDFGFAILDHLGLDSDLADLETMGVGGAGGVLGNCPGSGRAALNTIPSALIRWNEECRVIDGDSTHDCVTALKPSILEVVERVRDEELAERRAKRKKIQEAEDALKKKVAEEKEKEQQQEDAAAPSICVSETEVTSEPNQAEGPVDEEERPPAASADPTSNIRASAPRASLPAEDERVISQTAAQLAEDLAAAISSRVRDFGNFSPATSATVDSRTSSDHQTHQDERGSTTEPVAASTPSEGTAPPFFAPPASSSSTEDAPLPAALAPLSPSPVDHRSHESNDGDVAMMDSTHQQQHPFSDAMEVSSDSMPATDTDAPDHQQQSSELIEAARADPRGSNNEAPNPSSLENEPEPGPSGTSAAENNAGSSAQDTPDYSAILGIDVSELPDDVDPSFLAALPEEMRQEVIDEQRRLQNIRQRAAQSAPTEGVTEVSPEFLAALPPNIQEEVLAQQRMEQQRQAAATANPEAPVDPGEFLQNLPANLRQSVLADLEESQMSALPADLAAEAQNLRREFDLRNHRAMMHDRFFSHVGGHGRHGGATLSSILRNTVNTLGNQYHVIGGLGNGSREGWRFAGSGRGGFGGAGGQGYPASLLSSTNLKFKGRQLLDNEGLACLLILLFIDDAKINTTRLHRILKYLCYHGPTREWVVTSLLSILEKSNEGRVVEHNQGVAIGFDTPPTKIRKSTSKSSHLSDCPSTSTPIVGSSGSTSSNAGRTPAWLNISMDAALGFRANVFQVQRVSGKKSSSSVTDRANSVSIHPGASTAVCKHTLEVLISLAKSFPGHFLPWREVVSGTRPKQSAKSDRRGEANPADIWETLIRLDMQSTSKKGKSVVRSHSSVSNLSKGGEEDDVAVVTFETSPFGQLLSMLSSSVIRRSSVLTDKLLRLLSLISVGQPDVLKKDGSDSTLSSTTHHSIGVDHLKLAVEVLTSKACSEEGLEDVNALLLNLSYGPAPTRDNILRLLLQGAQELGNVVRQNVLDLQKELRKLKDTSVLSTGGDDEDSTPMAAEGQRQKGTLVDRYTKETVVLTAPSKVKGGSELQLPSMNALTSKTSSQAFFLRVLKVIIQLREAALLAMKKNRAAAATAAAAAAAAKPKATVTPPPGEEDQVVERQEGDDNMDVDPEERKDEKKAADTKEPVEDSLESLSEQLQLGSLWDTLSNCLKDLADTPDHHAVLVLQASVEAFFLVHAAATQPEDKKKVLQKETRQEQLAHIQEQLEVPPNLVVKPDPATGPSSLAGSSGQQQMSKDTERFLSFAETHRTVLNQILRQSTTHLADGPFSVLVDHTRVLDFDIKRRYFRTELERLDEGMRREDLAVHVRRDSVFEDSFRELHRRSADEWKNRFYIVFEGEEGQDAGGLLREWYVIISREIFNPMYALFKISPGDKVTYMIYEQSQTNPNHLDYFKFVGRVIAKAIYDNKLLECYFTRSFYKHILARPVRFQDMESEDYSFYKGLEFLIEHNVEDLGYDLTFSTEVREFGITEVRDLIPNGRNVRVTEETKLEYVHRVCQMKMTGAIRKQLSAFLEGFYNIIPRRLISIFNEQELELLLSGLPTVDVDDLKANTEYHKYQPGSLQIVWFWRALRSFDQTDKAKFMQFVTGSSKVPLQGFAALEGMNGPQKFQIHRDDRSTDRLPSAHTCFNQLDLPAYETYDKLRTYLLKAVQECSEGFGFA